MSSRWPLARCLPSDRHRPRSVAALLLLVPLALGDVVAPVADAGRIQRGHPGRDGAGSSQLAALTPAVTDPERPGARPADRSTDRACAT